MSTKLHHESVQRCLLTSCSAILCAVTVSGHRSGASLSLRGYFFLLFSTQQESICLPAFVFFCFCPVPSEGMFSAFHCPSTQHFLDLSCGNSEGCASYLLIQGNHQLNNFQSKILPQAMNLFAQVPAFEGSYPSRPWPKPPQFADNYTAPHAKRVTLTGTKLQWRRGTYLCPAEELLHFEDVLFRTALGKQSQK